VAVVLPFGYPDSSAPARESRQRRPLEELVHLERW
jgi:nitroreductase